MKVSIAGEERSGSSDEASDRERAKYENVNKYAIQIYVRARGARYLLFDTRPR